MTLFRTAGGYSTGRITTVMNSPRCCCADRLILCWKTIRPLFLISMSYLRSWAPYALNNAADFNLLIKESVLLGPILRACDSVVPSFSVCPRGRARFKSDDINLSHQSPVTKVPCHIRPLPCHISHLPCSRTSPHSTTHRGRGLSAHVDRK